MFSPSLISALVAAIMAFVSGPVPIPAGEWEPPETSIPAVVVVEAPPVPPDRPETAPPAPIAASTASGGVSGLGPWEGLVRCESGGDPAAVSGYGDFGLFQFRQPTWDGVARYLGRGDLVGAWIPGQPVAVQLMMAETLRTMPGGGLGHWACGWAYGR